MRSCGRARLRAGAAAARPARSGRPAATRSRNAVARPACVDAVLGHRDDDEVGEEGAIGIEVARRDGVVEMGADDEDAPVGRDRRDRRAAPVDHDQVRVELLGAPRAGEHVREADRTRETAAAAATADRRQPRQRGGLEMVGGGVPPGTGEREQIVTVGLTSTTSGSGGPPLPIATTTTWRPRETTRATWPVTAVFPTRLPVPITASEGVPIGSKRGGSSRKSAPS